MARTNLITASLCLVWMLSPDVLIRLGNGAGANQTLFVLGLLIAALLAARSLSLIQHPQLRRDGQADLTGVLVQEVGPTLATTLLVASRMALVLLVPTSVLVASGYAFNEIFLYWFPNFGFAYLLLGLITLLHLISESVARKAQLVFAALAVASLVILILAGLLNAGSSPDVVATKATFSAPLLVGCLLLFLGLEVSAEVADQPSRLPPFGALLVGLLLFLVWSMVSTQHVPAQRLSGTSIPHLITARALWGDTGRMLMGIAIIAGSCAVVNGLFHLAIGSLRGLADRGLLPGHPQGELMRRRYVILFTLIISVLMGKGLAGYEILDTYIQASLLLWLFVSGVQALAAATLLHKRGVKHGWHGYVIMVLYAVSAVYLMASGSETIPIARFLALVLLPTAALAAIWSRRRPARIR